MQLVSWYPFPLSTVTQRFGGNDNGLYAADGLKGHPGWDFVMPWGTPIPNCVDGAWVYSLMNAGNPDLMKYRAVCTMWDVPNSDYSYEIIYGHVSTIVAQVGQVLKPGQIIANVGNTGPVFVGGVEVTAAEKEGGSHAGAHLHYQVRLCKRVARTTPGMQYVYDGNGILYRNGCYYEIVNYGNGENGCVDPGPSFNGYQAKDYSTVLGILLKLVGVLTTEKTLLQQQAV